MKKADKAISKKIYREARMALSAIKEHPELDLPIREIRLHLLDEDGDGIGLWIEYNEETGELDRGMTPINSEMMESMRDELEEITQGKRLLN